MNSCPKGQGTIKLDLERDLLISRFEDDVIRPPSQQRKIARERFILANCLNNNYYSRYNLIFSMHNTKFNLSFHNAKLCIDFQQPIWLAAQWDMKSKSDGIRLWPKRIYALIHQDHSRTVQIIASVRPNDQQGTRHRTRSPMYIVHQYKTTASQTILIFVAHTQVLES